MSTEILVIDDNYDIRSLISNLLKELGFKLSQKEFDIMFMNIFSNKLKCI